MNRRGFLTSILALGAAPAIVKASSLMKVQEIWLPENNIISQSGIILYGDGINYDAPAIRALMDGKSVYDIRGRKIIGPYINNEPVRIPKGTYNMSDIALESPFNHKL